MDIRTQAGFTPITFGCWATFTAMATFITGKFLKRISQSGRLQEALEKLDSFCDHQKTALPSLAKLSSWECVLEEVLDTDHETEFYIRFANELLVRGYTRDEIKTMRRIAWETAGWFNFEMMAWDWCGLDKNDMITGANNRLEVGDISSEKHRELLMLIEKYETPPNKSLERDAASWRPTARTLGHYGE